MVYLVPMLVLVEATDATSANEKAGDIIVRLRSNMNVKQGILRSDDHMPTLLLPEDVKVEDVESYLDYGDTARLHRMQEQMMRAYANKDNMRNMLV